MGESFAPAGLGGLLGIQVVRSSMIPSREYRQVRFPRSKRRRIRRKWRKNRANWGNALLPPVVYQMGSQLIANEAGYQMVMAAAGGVTP